MLPKGVSDRRSAPTSSVSPSAALTPLLPPTFHTYGHLPPSQVGTDVGFEPKRGLKLAFSEVCQGLRAGDVGTQGGGGGSSWPSVKGELPRATSFPHSVSPSDYMHTATIISKPHFL